MHDFDEAKTRYQVNWLNHKRESEIKSHKCKTILRRNGALEKNVLYSNECEVSNWPASEPFLNGIASKKGKKRQFLSQKNDYFVAVFSNWS